MFPPFIDNSSRIFDGCLGIHRGSRRFRKKLQGNGKRPLAKLLPSYPGEKEESQGPLDFPFKLLELFEGGTMLPMGLGTGQTER
jgi:hypothetical protein